MKEKETHSALFAIIRFLVLGFSYLIVLCTFNNFKNLCTSLLVFMLTITSDYLILLFTSEKNQMQYRITLVMFVLSNLIVVFLGLGIIGIATVGADNILTFRNISNNTNIYTLENFYIGYVFIGVFVIICGYIFEYTGLLKREPIKRLNLQQIKGGEGA